MMPLWTTATRSVAIGWALASVGRPWVAQRVWPMPIVPCTGSRVEPRREVGELALGAAALDAAVDQGRDPGRIIAAVFEPPQPLDQPAATGRLPMMPMMPHISPSPCAAARARLSRHAARRAPGLSTWRARANASASAGTSAVMTLPAAT